MKTNYIYDMPAGKEMDILVAEKVMGLCAHDWKLIPNDDDGVCRICQKCHLEFWGLRPPVYGAHYGSYSTDITAAWEVLEKMGSYKLRTVHTSEETKHEATFWRGMMGFPVKAETAPLAICRSALLAITYKLE
jgi:hypothetical protein